jgi:glucokinase
MILAGDIGGTKTNLALFEEGGPGGVGELVLHQSFPSRDYGSLEAILGVFTSANRHDVSRAGFGIAGAVVNGRVETLNLPWVITERALADLLGLDRVTVVNDLASMALGIAHLRPHQVLELQPGRPAPEGNRGLIAAGTGCGMAGLVYHEGRYLTLSSEGGHVELGPRGGLEIELLRYLAKRYGHVSYERVLSGPGLVNVYSFLRDGGYAREPEWMARRMAEGDPAAAVSGAALAGECELAGMALDMFVSVYGAAAGNLALTVLATGGLYVGGGIAPKIIDRIKAGGFLAAFHDKGRYVDLMRDIPVRVILDEHTALYGSAHAALA